MHNMHFKGHIDKVPHLSCNIHKENKGVTTRKILISGLTLLCHLEMEEPSSSSTNDNTLGQTMLEFL
jgi:hypothetical protein